jgi:hypothetical protein
MLNGPEDSMFLADCSVWLSSAVVAHRRGLALFVLRVMMTVPGCVEKQAVSFLPHVAASAGRYF